MYPVPVNNQLAALEPFLTKEVRCIPLLKPCDGQLCLMATGYKHMMTMVVSTYQEMYADHHCQHVGRL